MLTQRGNPPKRGVWSVPGGGIEVGETTQAAARREIKEELGIEIELRGVVDVVDIILRDENERVQFHYIVVDYLGVNPRGEVTPASDVLDARWARADELDAFDVPELTQKVIRKAFAMANAK